MRESINWNRKYDDFILFQTDNEIDMEVIYICIDNK